MVASKLMKKHLKTRYGDFECRTQKHYFVEIKRDESQVLRDKMISRLSTYTEADSCVFSSPTTKLEIDWKEEKKRKTYY